MSELPELTGARTLRPESVAGGVSEADVETPGAVVTALYDAISGPAESERDAKRFWRDQAFRERELGGWTERFGNVAHRISSYESLVGAEEEPAARGVNSFQLIRFGGRWWITSVVWDVETPDRPIPGDLDG